jgi:predicted HTH transcriptional regulator
LLGANYELKNRYLVIDAPKDLVQQNDTQEDKFDTQEDKFDTQGYFTEGVIPQKKELEAWIEHQIKKDPKISTGKLAELAKVSVSTIKRRIAKHGSIKFVGSGFSGYWIVERSDD